MLLALQEVHLLLDSRLIKFLQLDEALEKKYKMRKYIGLQLLVTLLLLLEFPFTWHHQCKSIKNRWIAIAVDS